MKIKELAKQDPGFQYVIDNLELMSAAGRRCMLDSVMMTDGTPLEEEWQRLGRVISAARMEENSRAMVDLRHCLMQLHDLQGTLQSLAMHSTLNEVELFELKNLALLCMKAVIAIRTMKLVDVLPLPDLSDVFSILDPDKTGIANFYIYDSYDMRLAPLRRELKSLQEHNGDPKQIAILLSEQNDIQNSVCLRLCDRLYPYCDQLRQGLETLAYADFLIAKAELAERWSLTCPRLGEVIKLRGLFNPRLRDRNATLGLRYQPVDIELHRGVTLITGANMAGKTVLLKSVATAQMMAQCGLYAPAEEATFAVVENIASSIGDEQNEMSGLSSYAAEIIKISGIVVDSRNRRMLALIDEPARTTNPVEGKALVQAIVDLLDQSDSFTLVTTHYSGLGAGQRKLRVKGFVEGLSDLPLTPTTISHFIDYSLEEDDTSTDVPHEALRIASILGCDAELIKRAQESLSCGGKA